MKPLIALCAFLLAACGSTTYKIDQYHQDPEAERSRYQGKKLFVAPLLLAAASVGNSSPSVDSGKQALHINKDSLAKVYNRGLEERFRKAFRNVSVVPGPDFARYNDVLSAEKLEETAHFYGKGKVEYYFKHPKSEVLDSLGLKADLIVYLTSLTVSIKDVRTSEAQPGGGGWGPTSVSFAGGKPVATTAFMPGGGGSLREVLEPRLTAFAKYIVWDYGSNSALAYGQFQIESGVDRDDIQGHWEDISETVTRRIAANTSRLH